MYSAGSFDLKHKVTLVVQESSALKAHGTEIYYSTIKRTTVAKSLIPLKQKASGLVSSYLLFEFMVVFQWLLELVLWRLEHEGYYM